MAGRKKRERRGGRPKGGSDAIVRAVLEATLRQLGDRGFYGVSVDEIAKTAGVNKTSVYRRWPSRGALVLAALQTLRDQEPPPPQTGSLREDLIAMLSAKVAIVGTRSGRKILRALIAFEDEEVARVARALRKLRYRVPIAVIHHAIARGELPAGTDPSLLAEVVLAPMYYRIIVLNQPVTRRYIERVVDQVLAGAQMPLQLRSARRTR
jgi:AcrR family transcriptional regulator